MNKTKRGFLIAGSIIAIVMAFLSFSTSKIFDLAKDYITEETIIESYKQEGYVKYENADGSYELILEDSVTYEKTMVKDEEVKLIVETSIKLLDIIKKALIIVSGISLVLAVIILINTSKNKCPKWPIVSLLIVSLLSVHYLTMAFMIVALCLKDKPKVVVETNGDDVILQ